MNRSFYNTGDPFLYGSSGAEPVGSGMDCLPLRQSSTSPFHLLISEQAKSLVALQELQNEVGALLEFRDLVMETFPNLRTKLAAAATPPPSAAAMTTTGTSSTSNIPICIRQGDYWTPGIRVRKKITTKNDELRSGKKSGEIAVQDSGFSTETSSKETHSASSTAPPAVVEDELWSLLDLIHRKGTRLRDEVDALQCSIRDNEPNFERVLFHGSADDLRELREQRDVLLDRLAEMEAEMLAGRVHTSRLQGDLESLLTAKQELEEQLKAVVSQRGEVNSRIHDLHTQFVARTGIGEEYYEGRVSKTYLNSEYSQRTLKSRGASGSLLDAVLDYKLPKVKVCDGRIVAAILKEHDVLALKRHLLRSTIQNQVLQDELNKSVGLESGLRSKLDKTREENDELRFQLEDKNIELEGTRARVRVLEQLQKPSISPDIIPTVRETSSSPSQPQQPSRSEITTASMKAMSPLNLQLDHSSSTESAHDQMETSGSRREVKRRPSKIPLKSYTAPKPPASGGGKQSPAPPRSRSGDRPNSAQLWKNSQTNSLNNNNNNNNSKSANTPKSRNSSLVSAKDSLSSKLRSSDSLSKLSAASGGSSVSNGSTIKKQQGGTKWGTQTSAATQAATSGTSTSEKINSKGGSPSPWIHSSFNNSICEADSLDRTTTTDNSTSQHFQTANTFLWNNAANVEFYDSIDSNLLTSSSYQMNGEELAEYDSLDGHLSHISARNNK